MYKTDIVLEIHAYANEQLCDICFDDAPYYGIHGAEIMLPFAKARGLGFSFEYDDKTTTSDLIAFIQSRIGCSNDCWYAESFFIDNDDRYQFFIDEPLIIKRIIDKYFDGVRKLTIGLFISCDAGEIMNEYPLRYYVHSMSIATIPF